MLFSRFQKTTVQSGATARRVETDLWCIVLPSEGSVYHHSWASWKTSKTENTQQQDKMANKDMASVLLAWYWVGWWWWIFSEIWLRRSAPTLVVMLKVKYFKHWYRNAHGESALMLKSCKNRDAYLHCKWCVKWNMSCKMITCQFCFGNAKIKASGTFVLHVPLKLY